MVLCLPRTAGTNPDPRFPLVFLASTVHTFSQKRMFYEAQGYSASLPALAILAACTCSVQCLLNSTARVHVVVHFPRDFLRSDSRMFFNILYRNEVVANGTGLDIAVYGKKS